MRSLSMLVALSLCCSLAHAEPEVLVPLHLIPAAVEPQNLSALRISVADREQRAKTLRNTGIAFTVIGTVMTGIGVGLFMAGVCFDNCGSDPMLFAAGTSLLAFGQLAVVSGIPIWAIGQTRVSRAQAVQVSLSPSGVGLKF